jgi:hypothetical protein
MEVSLKVGRYLRKMVHQWLLDVCSQSSYSSSIAGGYWGQALLYPSQNPSCAYRRHSLEVVIYEVIVFVRGVWMPRPPSLMEILAMSWA